MKKAMAPSEYNDILFSAFLGQAISSERILIMSGKDHAQFLRRRFLKNHHMKDAV